MSHLPIIIIIVIIIITVIYCDVVYSRDRNVPFEFVLGQGQVIQGWDKGLLGMCPGSKRKLTIPPHLGYGDAGAGNVCLVVSAREALSLSSFSKLHFIIIMNLYSQCAQPKSVIRFPHRLSFCDLEVN